MKTHTASILKKKGKEKEIFCESKASIQFLSEKPHAFCFYPLILQGPCCTTPT